MVAGRFEKSSAPPSSYQGTVLEPVEFKKLFFSTLVLLMPNVINYKYCFLI
jgi:hypothetical protein